MRTDSGRVVVVTGANGGIGYHLLRALRDDGYRVAGFDTDTSNLAPLAAGDDGVRAYDCDVTVDAEVRAAVDDVVDAWGGVDILVNNAAVLTLAPFEERTLADIREELDVNYLGYVRTIRAVLPHMRERGSGIVHNMCSGVAAVGHPGLSGYAASKGAIAALARSLRSELRHSGVAFTLMYPPATATPGAAVLDYPAAAVQEPEAVGRKLAAKVESTDARVYADLSTRLGMALVSRVPALAAWGTRKYVADPA
ncbi:SDR family NAD(P)-dependent oxidoreductase [Halosegnis marinus]|uniref:SDR family NAD(P)-dependent oxidoreductase n=1 Tax=Halosegnis marinus TaxID=3034023 RepID=A0ABD5ZMR9_9EURY|nr:SDR family NAD(P)-dependent oxidoreductase [Halosegnis sp. DT85]